MIGCATVFELPSRYDRSASTLRLGLATQLYLGFATEPDFLTGQLPSKLERRKPAVHRGEKRQALRLRLVPFLARLC